jgi:hypothetical protein
MRSTSTLTVVKNVVLDILKLAVIIMAVGLLWVLSAQGQV